MSKRAQTSVCALFMPVPMTASFISEYMLRTIGCDENRKQCYKMKQLYRRIRIYAQGRKSRRKSCYSENPGISRCSAKAQNQQRKCGKGKGCQGIFEYVRSAGGCPAQGFFETADINIIKDRCQKKPHHAVEPSGVGNYSQNNRCRRKGRQHCADCSQLGKTPQNRFHCKAPLFFED